ELGGERARGRLDHLGRDVAQAEGEGERGGGLDQCPLHVPTSHGWAVHSAGGASMTKASSASSSGGSSASPGGKPLLASTCAMTSAYCCGSRLPGALKGMFVLTNLKRAARLMPCHDSSRGSSRGPMPPGSAGPWPPEPRAANTSAPRAACSSV